MLIVGKKPLPVQNGSKFAVTLPFKPVLIRLPMNRLFYFLLLALPSYALSTPAFPLSNPLLIPHPEKVDTFPPAINCPAAATLTLPAGKCDTVFSYMVVAYDDMPGYVLTQTAGLPSGAAFPVGITLNQYTVTDSNGQTATCSFTVTVLANMAPLVCRNSLTVNLGVACTHVLTAAQVLENGTNVCEAAFRVQVKRNGAWVVPNLGHKDIGKTIEFRVERLDNGATCTGNVTVRDNLAPTLNCKHISVSCAIPNPTPDYLADSLNIADARPQVTDNCYSKVRLTFVDTSTPSGCDTIGDTVGNIFRTWQATDSSGNGVTCRQRIRLFSVFNGIQFPADTALSCSHANTLPGATGRPYILANNRRIPLSEGGTCDVGIAFTDNIQAICGGTYRLRRTWLVVNWCKPNTPGNPISHIQTIDVKDDTKPILTCPPGVTLSAPSKDCTAKVNLPDVVISDACSFPASITAYWPVKNGLDSLSGTLMAFPGNNPALKDTLGVLDTASQFPVGTTMVRYVAADVCGNTGECQVAVQVWDQTPPKAACKAVVTAWLGSPLSAATIDAGSTDDCSALSFRARRVGANSCFMTTNYADSLQFCCADIGDTVVVQLRVYDVPVPTKNTAPNFATGQWSECTAWVVVADTLPLRCIAPPDVTVACDTFAADLAVYGQAISGCVADTIIETINAFLFNKDCKIGTLVRQFKAVDAAGNSKTCSQRIVVNDQPDDYVVRFPDDVMVTNCQTQTNFGMPLIGRADCENMSLTYIDDTLDMVPDACFQVERRWFVRNLCHYDSSKPLIFVPNPMPNTPAEHPGNLAGPIVAPAGTAAPWAPSSIRINPNDPTPTSYATYWQADANGYEYIQILNFCCPKRNVSVLGWIHTGNNKNVEGATVLLQASHTSFPAVQNRTALTDTTGHYRFIEVFPPGSMYELAPQKDENPLSGVTTLDLALISRHILGLDTLDTPYQIIAADANKSNTVTTFDVVEFRKMILGIYEKLPLNQSWRFVPKAYVFPNPLTPFTPPFPEKVSVANATQDTAVHHFVGIKVGDVNQSFMLRSANDAADRATDTVFMELPNRRMVEGDVFDVDVRSNKPIIGFQFTLNFCADLELLDIQAGQATTIDQFQYFPDAGAMTAAWYSPLTASPAFRLRFRARKSGLFSECLSLSNRITKVEGYTDVNSSGPLPVVLRFDDSSLPQTIELYQNRPNPFRAATRVGLYFPETEMATFTIADLTGRVVHRTRTLFHRGENELLLNDAVFGGKSGIYFYRIETDKVNIVKKMIRD